jgi:hypothetical protein
MLAGGMTIAAPSMMVPEAAAAGALYVSAENAMFDNTFGGAQIIEVVVIDPNRSLTNEGQGEPTVKVDEQKLRMAQGIDGNWYAYFGDATTVPAADRGSNNLDFGTSDALDVVTVGNTTGSYWQGAGSGVITNAPLLSNFNASGSAVVIGAGQIGINHQAGTDSEWPLIQTFNLTIETFDVVLEQAGADEVVTLNFDSADLDDFASIELDRNAGSQESQVHLVITDNQLNIDPTAEDIVIFYVADGRNGGVNSEGVSFTDGSTYTSAIYKNWSNSFDDNGKLIINNNTNSAATTVFVNDETIDDTSADNYMVFFEGGENSGIFYNTDDDDDASLEVNTFAKRGTTATIDYNDSAQSFVVANDFGVLDMDAASVGDEWNSG